MLFLRTALGSDTRAAGREPFSALDASHRREMRVLRFLEGVWSSVLVITHDVDEAAAMASCM